MDHFFQIMGARREMLEMAFQGLLRSGVPLVAWDGAGFRPVVDDQGLYYFAPAIARALGTGVEGSARSFLCMLIGAGLLASFFCLCRIFPQWKTRSYAGFMLLSAGIITVRPFDVYVAPMFLVLSVIPLFLLLGRARLDRTSGAALFVAGILAGYCNFIRSQSGTGTILFLVLWTWLNFQGAWGRRSAAVLVLFLGFSVPYAHFHAMERDRDGFLRKNDPSYVGGGIHHRFWHNAYIGLGYYPNRYGIRYDDQKGIEEAASLDPGAAYLSPRYEAVLRGEVFRLARTDPWFIFRNIALKSVQLVLYLLILGNVGWYFLARSKLPARALVPFAAGILFYLAPGVLIIPRLAYTLGAIGMTLLLAVYGFGRAMEKGGGPLSGTGLR